MVLLRFKTKKIALCKGKNSIVYQTYPNETQNLYCNEGSIEWNQLPDSWEQASLKKTTV